MQDFQNYTLKKLLSKKIDDAIVSSNEINTTQIKFSKNKIVATTTQDSKNIDIFVSKEKRTAFTTLKNITKNSIDKTINALIKILKNSEQNKEYFGIAEGPFKYRKIKETFDKKILNTNAADIIEKGINEALTSGAKDTNGIFRINVGCNRLITTGSIDVNSKYTNTYFSLRAIVNKDVTGHDVSISNTIKKINIDETAKNAGEIAANSKNPKHCQTGNYDVIFTPLAAAAILMNVGDAASSYKVDAGFSCLKGKIGQRLCTKQINIFDNGTMPNGYNSRVYDAEGVPSQKTPIIKDGILKNYLHNTSTAKKYRTKTTANAGLIIPQPTNIAIQEGKTKKEDLIKDIKKGILITNLWYTRFKNYETGDFSTIPRDGIFFIENGEIKNAIKGIRVNSNLLHILKNIFILGKDTKQILSWEVDVPVFTPSLFVKNINITTPK